MNRRARNHARRRSPAFCVAHAEQGCRILAWVAGVLFEDDGFVPVEQDAVFAVPFEGTSQHLALGVTSQSGQVLDRFAVVHAGDVLLDDGAFVQVSGHVVGGGTNQLHASLMRLVIGLGAFEAR